MERNDDSNRWNHSHGTGDARRGPRQSSVTVPRGAHSGAGGRGEFAVVGNVQYSALACSRSRSGTRRRRAANPSVDERPVASARAPDASFDLRGRSAPGYRVRPEIPERPEQIRPTRPRGRRTTRGRATPDPPRSIRSRRGTRRSWPRLSVQGVRTAYAWVAGEDRRLSSIFLSWLVAELGDELFGERRDL